MLPVPYLAPVERSLSIGITTRISGSSHSSARRFNINFQCGPSINPRDDVAFHLAVDFDSLSIIANNILGGQWGPQECETRNFPFRRGAEFTIEAVCDHTGFQVKVNGAHALRFEHRLEASRITHLAIDGDIILHRVEYLSGSQGSYGAPIGFSIPSTTPIVPPYPSPTLPPYPTSSPYPQGPYAVPQGPGSNPPPYSSQPAGYPNGGPFPPQTGLYPQQPGPYPQQTGPYPTQPGAFSQQPGAYPQQHNLYPQQPGVYPQHPHSPGAHHKEKGLLDKIGLGTLGGLAGGAATGAAGLVAVKNMKKQAKFSKKAQKKALKYGIPLAGAGLGVYALKKTHGLGMFKGSSSSSSSSDSD